MNGRAYITAVAIGATAFAAAACDRRADDRATTPYSAPEAASQASDSQIATRIRGAYFTAPEVKTQAIEVAVNDGVVKLDGTVPDAQTRDRAVAIARGIDGVKRVDTELSVAEAASTTADARKSDARNTADAGWITTKVQAQYFVKPGVGPWNIDVTTSKDGTVTLTGSVDSEAERDKAVQIARNTDGVTNVDDQLRIADAATGTAGSTASSDSSLGDAWITAKIQSKYFVDPDVKGRDINVDTNGGIVTLRGDVGSYSERRQAASMARQTDGVKEVRDELRVSSANGAASTSGARRAAQVDDAWIQTKLQSKFFADAELRGQSIRVESRNGVVTLSGSVTSSDARDAAEQIARDTEGVKRVVDRMSAPAESK